VGGDRKAFEEAMQTAADCAWEKDWAAAAEAYRRALSEYPKDVNALSGMGLALSGIGEWEAALEGYRQASEISPHDPVLLERMGQVREQLGRKEEAARAYMASAQCYLDAQQAIDLAVRRWQDAISAWPDCPEAHASLLTYYQEQGQANKAVGECLALSRIYHSSGQHRDALLACEYALCVDPHHPDVHTRMSSLRQKAGESAEDEETQRGKEEGKAIPSMTQLVGPAPEAAQAAQAGAEAQGRRDSPVGVTHREALAHLAESLFDEELIPEKGNGGASKSERDALIGRAVDQDTRGRAEEAIEAYQSAIHAGAEHPALHFNLGLLYQEALRFDEAIAEYGKALGSPEYEMGCHFALGECLRARGRRAASNRPGKRQGRASRRAGPDVLAPGDHTPRRRRQGPRARVHQLARHLPERGRMAGKGGPGTEQAGRACPRRASPEPG
jgi:tetratricopeptide (TPR) repeat protein